MAYITTRDAFVDGKFVGKGSEITFPVGSKIPKWVIESGKFKPSDIPAEPVLGDTKPPAAQEAVKKKRAELNDLA